MNVYEVTVATDRAISGKVDTYLVGASSLGAAEKVGAKVARADVLDIESLAKAKQAVTCVKYTGELNTRSSVAAFMKEQTAKIKKAKRAARAFAVRRAQKKG